MRYAPVVLVAVVAATAAGCSYSDGTRYGYSTGPNYAYAPQPYYGYSTPASRYNGYSSRWDYYRNYGGTYHPGPETYP